MCPPNLDHIAAAQISLDDVLDVFLSVAGRLLADEVDQHDSVVHLNRRDREAKAGLGCGPRADRLFETFDR